MRVASSRLRVTVALAAGLFFYALSDVLLWQRIFEQHDLFQFDMQYQTGHVATLVGFIAIGMVLLIDAGWWALWYGAAFYTAPTAGPGAASDTRTGPVRPSTSPITPVRLMDTRGVPA